MLLDSDLVYSGVRPLSREQSDPSVSFSCIPCDRKGSDRPQISPLASNAPDQTHTGLIGCFTNTEPKVIKSSLLPVSEVAGAWGKKNRIYFYFYKKTNKKNP